LLINKKEKAGQKRYPALLMALCTKVGYETTFGTWDDLFQDDEYTDPYVWLVL
jgi:hypothetical protein